MITFEGIQSASNQAWDSVGSFCLGSRHSRIDAPESNMRSIFYIFLTVLISGTLSKRPPLVSQWLAACKEQYDITSVDVYEADLVNDTNPPQKLKCFYKCALERVLVLDSGRFSRAIRTRTTELLSEENIDPNMQIAAQTTQNCFRTTGVDDCDLAYNFLRCMYPVISKASGSN